MNDQIGSYRKQIDEIDEQILSLLSNRGQLATKIGTLKREEGGSVHVPSREKLIFDRLIKRNKGPFKNEAILSIYCEIISATRALEAPLSISFLGPEATFTHMAAVKHFGSSADFIPTNGIQQIFDEVEKGHSDYGVVPIENSTEGVVSHTLDMFSESSLDVCAEIILRVSHHLLSQETSLQTINVVYSHAHALAQCRQWLTRHLPHGELKDVESTGAAAKMVASKPQTAAIASEIASSVYGIPVLEKEIQDQAQNYTRFLVIGRHRAKKTGWDKTSILFTIRDEVGGLFKVLGGLARAKINLTKIQSRPLKKRAWEYLFFVDLDGHRDEPRISKALTMIRKKCILFRIIGSYPKSKVEEQ